GRSSLVFARTTDATTPSVAVLRQPQGTTKIGLTTPPSNRMLGRAFNLPLGDLSSGPNNLYIANPNGADTQAIIQFGASTSPVDSIVTIPANGIVKVPISATHAQTN